MRISKKSFKQKFMLSFNPKSSLPYIHIIYHKLPILVPQIPSIYVYYPHVEGVTQKGSLLPAPLILYI